MCLGALNIYNPLNKTGQTLSVMSIADPSTLIRLGFKGEFTELNREPFEVLYEKAANPKDHELAAGIGERGTMSGGRHGM